MKRILLAISGLLLARIIFASNGNSNSDTNISTTNDSNDKATNLDAFLKTIQYAEGTFNQPNPYAVTYAYDHVIRNFSDHPAITGEWLGKVLPERFCTAVNLPTGCKSTASGAYQIIKPTWQSIKRKTPSLKFDKEGQDLAAIQLISEKNALNDILNGAFETAINKCNTIWASLPNSPYGQPVRSMADLRNFYLSQNGKLHFG